MTRNIPGNEKQRPVTKATQPSKVLKVEGEIRTFQDKRRLKEYTSTKQALQYILKG